MKIGVSTLVTDDGMSPAALAKAVEERGFEALLVAEHSHIPVKRETPYPGGGELPRPYFRAFDPFVVLAAAASVTSTLTLGTAVSLLVQRDVIHTAKSLASLGVVAGNRLLFGVAVGWNREEMRNHGTDPRTRGALLDEQIEALQAIWTQEEATYLGRHIRFERIVQRPKPDSPPPIFVGGNTDVALARARRLGTGWMPVALPEPDEIKAQLARAGETRVTATSAIADRRVLDAYAEGGAERVTVTILPGTADRTLSRLDQLAALTVAYR